MTRRDFLAQGFLTGAATVVAPRDASALLNPRRAHARCRRDIEAMKALTDCNITQRRRQDSVHLLRPRGRREHRRLERARRQAGGQLDFLTTQGYSKHGLPGDMLPNNPTTNFVNTEFGLAFHADSAFLRGMLEKTSATTRAGVNGAVIPARSENDTGNNPHNPMYGIAKAGLRKGELLTLIGSQNSDSGGNSMAPAMMIDPANPTDEDRPPQRRHRPRRHGRSSRTMSQQPDRHGRRARSRWCASAASKLPTRVRRSCLSTR